MRSVRLLFLALDVDLSRNRGDAIHVRNLARSLSRLGHSVHLLVGASQPADPIDGVAVSVPPNGGDATIVRHVLRAGRKLRPDVIYERRFSPKISAAVAALLGIPYVVEINGIPEEEAAMQGRPLPSGPGATIKKRARYGLLRRASAIVAVTEGLRAAVTLELGVGPAKSHVVPNGVDPDLFRPLNREEARRTLSLAAGPTVCFVGNLVRWQGLGVLIDAMTRSRSPFHVIAVGRGPEQTPLIAAASDAGVLPRITFVGDVLHAMVPTFIAASDVCAAPFTAERNLRSGVSALKVYEYLACGRPIVASAVPGVVELIEEYGAGVAVRPGDADGLARAIDRVLAEPSFRDAALHASGVVRERHSWDRTAFAVSRILEQVTVGRAPRARGERQS